MPNVAMYHALKDSDVTLQQDPNSKAGFDFNPPDDIQLPDSGLSMPAIQFGVFSQTALSNVVLRVRLVQFHFNPNPGGQPLTVTTLDREVFKRTFNGHVAGTFTEFFPGSFIDLNENHRFVFNLVSGNAPLIISDVMFLFQRHI